MFPGLSEATLLTLCAALFSSPVLTAVVSRAPIRDTRNQLEIIQTEMEKVSQSFLSYKTENALKDFTAKTLRITQKNSSAVTLEEWVVSMNTLEKMLPEASWPDTLKEEVRIAREIIRKGDFS